MIEINLLPQELRKKEASKLVIPNIFNKQFVVTVGVIFVAAHILLGVLVIYQNIHLGHAKRQTALLKKSTEQTSRYKAEIKANKDRLAQLERMTSRKFSWTRVINILSDSVPKGLWLHSFVVVEDKRMVSVTKEGESKGGKPAKRVTVQEEQKISLLKLKGSVVSNGQETATIGRFIKALKDDPYFSSVFDEVEFFNIAQRKIKSFDVYDFTITCVFKKDKF